MSVEAALKLFTDNENAVASEAKPGFDLFRQIGDRLHEGIAPLRDVVVHRFRQTRVDEPKPETVVSPVIQGVHIRGARNQGIEAGRQPEGLNRALPDGDARCKGTGKALVAAPDFGDQSRPQLTVGVHLREFSAWILLVPQVGDQMAARKGKKSRALVVQDSQEIGHHELVAPAATHPSKLNGFPERVRMEESPDPLRHGTEIRLWQVPGFDQCSFGSSEGGAQRWWWVKFGVTKNSRVGADVGSKGATTSD